MIEQVKKVALGMSGGVDSSVAAKLLLDQGYEVVGFMMKFWSDTTGSCTRENACCDEQAVIDARAVATKLGIAFYVVDVREEFKRSVVDYFIEEYKNLRTPNPCVKCNELIKFGWMWDFAKKTGCDYIATGHYARVASKQSAVSSQQSGQGSEQLNYQLLKGVDTKKDQSYFLYRVTQEQLAHTLFPIGDFTKDEIRAKAKELDLPVYEKKESQEVCFIRDKDYREFLRKQLPAKYFAAGEIVDKAGKALGQHEGLINYTIGQRKGISQSEVQTANSKPLYVIGFQVEKNQLIVGAEEELFRAEMSVADLVWLDDIAGSKDIKVKIRYRAEAVSCKISRDKGRATRDGEQKTQDSCLRSSSPSDEVADLRVDDRNDTGEILVRFDQPQRAITPGQSAVFYQGERVIGGGIIRS